MAVPFYIPEEDETNVSSTTNGEASATSSAQNSPSRPIPIPLRSNPQTPQHSPIDNEVLVQAFYEAICRCSQGNFLLRYLKKYLRDKNWKKIMIFLVH